MHLQHEKGRFCVIGADGGARATQNSPILCHRCGGGAAAGREAGGAKAKRDRYSVCPPMNSRKMLVGGMAAISEGWSGTM